MFFFLSSTHRTAFIWFDHRFLSLSLSLPSPLPLPLVRHISIDNFTLNIFKWIKAIKRKHRKSQNQSHCLNSYWTVVYTHDYVSEYYVLMKVKRPILLNCWIIRFEKDRERQRETEITKNDSNYCSLMICTMFEVEFHSICFFFTFKASVKKQNQ